MTTFDTPLEVEAKRKRGRRGICRCGHAESWHKVNLLGQAMCKGGGGGGEASNCECGRMIICLTADDARDFMFSASSGEHPLLLGIRKTKTKGRDVHWVDGQNCCDVGGCTKEAATAVWGSADTTLLLCGDHMKGR